MSADERKDEGAGDPRNERSERGGVVIPPWVPNAWEMRIVGMQSWESIASAVGHHWESVKKWVIAYSQMLGEVADNEDVIHSRAEYVASLQRIKRQAEETVVKTPNEFAKIGALNTKLRACEKLAAAKGVVTERKAEEVSGSLDVTMIGKLRPKTRRLLTEDLEGADAEEEDEVAVDEEGG